MFVSFGKQQDEVGQGVELVEGLVDVVEGSEVLVVVVVVGVAAAGVVVLEAGVVEDLGVEVDHRSYVVPTSGSYSDFW